MANALYPKARSRFLTGDIDMIADTITLVAVGPTYVYDPMHEYLDDVTGTVGTPTNLSGKTVLDNGVFDASDISYLGVALSATVRGLIIYKNTGSAGSSVLIYYADTNSDGSPITRVGDGAGIPILWDNGASRIFRL